MNRNWNDRDGDHHDYGRFSRDHDRDHSGQSFGTRHDDDRQRQAARDGSECDPYGRLMTDRMGEDGHRAINRAGGPGDAGHARTRMTAAGDRAPLTGASMAGTWVTTTTKEVDPAGSGTRTVRTMKTAAAT